MYPILILHQIFLFCRCTTFLDISLFTHHHCQSYKLSFWPDWHNCMATHLNSCASSSSTTFTPSSFKNETHLSNRFVILPRKPHSFSWVSQIRLRIRARKHFQLKSSNGHPLNAVSLQDGEFWDLLFCWYVLSPVSGFLSCFELLAFSYLILSILFPTSWYCSMSEKCVCISPKGFSYGYGCWIGFRLSVSLRLILNAVFNLRIETHKWINSIDNGKYFLDY